MCCIHSQLAHDIVFNFTVSLQAFVSISYTFFFAVEKLLYLHTDSGETRFLKSTNLNLKLKKCSDLMVNSQLNQVACAGFP